MPEGYGRFSLHDLLHKRAHRLRRLLLHLPGLDAAPDGDVLGIAALAAPPTDRFP